MIEQTLETKYKEKIVKHIRKDMYPVVFIPQNLSERDLGLFLNWLIRLHRNGKLPKELISSITGNLMRLDVD